MLFHFDMQLSLELQVARGSLMKIDGGGNQQAHGDTLLDVHVLGRVRQENSTRRALQRNDERKFIFFYPSEYLNNENSY